MKEIELNRKFWSPTADDTKSNVFRGDTVEGTIIASPRTVSGRNGDQTLVNILQDDEQEVIVKLNGYLGEVWQSVKPALQPGEVVKFCHTKVDGRSRFKLFVDRN